MLTSGLWSGAMLLIFLVLNLAQTTHSLNEQRATRIPVDASGGPDDPGRS